MLRDAASTQGSPRKIDGSDGTEKLRDLNSRFPIVFRRPLLADKRSTAAKAR